MIAKKFNDLATHLLVPSAAAAIARATTLMLDTNDGFGSGVLVAGNIVLTSAHNFEECLPKEAVVRRPYTGEKSSILEAELLFDLDMAVVILKEELVPPYATLCDFTEIEYGTRLIAPRFFNPNNTNYEQMSEFGRFSERTIRRGFVISPSTVPPQLEKTKILKENGDKLASEACQMFLGAVDGDSGVGVFTHTGRLITILNNGNSLASSGPTVESFREACIKRKIYSPGANAI